MATKIFTIRFDAAKDLFDDEGFSNFLLNKRVVKLVPAFFQYNDTPYWSVFVEYEPLLGETKALKQGLNAAQNLLYQRLKEWRKEKAEQNKTPVFIIATNSQLEDVVQQAPRSLEALRQINGFGKKKLERYGRELIEMISAFYEKKAVSPKKASKKSQPKTETDSAS